MADDLDIIVPNSRMRSPTLRDVAAVFFRNKRLVAGSFCFLMTAGVVYAALFPSYRAEMKVLVRRGRIDPAVTPTPSPSPAFEHDEVSEEELNSEVEVLQDSDVLREVVIQTGLSRPTWVARLMRQSPEEREEKAVRRLATRLDVQPVRKSRLISVSYSSHDPEQSALVLRALAHAYMAKQAEIGRPSGQQSFFEEQVSQSRNALEEAQANLIAFTRTHGVVSAALERDLALQKLSDAQASQLGIESDNAAAGERERALAAKLRELPAQKVVQIKNSDNPQLQQMLQSKLLDLQLKRTELLTKFEPSYRLVQQVDAEIAEAKSAIEAEDLKPLREETTEDNPEYQWATSELLKSQVELAALRQKEAVADRQVAEYHTQAEKLGEQAVTQRDLEQKLKSAEEKWLLYSNKREEARIGDALDQNKVLNVAIAQEPRKPTIPVWPLWAATLVSFFGACGLTTGIVFAADYLDPSLRTPDEVLQVLGTPVLASLPANGERTRHRSEAI